MPYVKLEIEPGLDLFIEPSEQEQAALGGPEMIGVQEVVLKAGETFERSLESARAATARIFDKLVQQLPNKPQQIELTFGLKFSAKFDAWVVGSQGEGHFDVKMVWKL